MRILKVRQVIRHLKYLAFFRKERGLTQAMLAEMANIGVNSIARYERDEIKPSIETANIIAHILGVTVEELLSGPSLETWELKILMKKEGVIDMTEKKSSAVLNIGDEAMAITLSAGYELWEDDAKFEELIEQLECCPRVRKSGTRRQKSERQLDYPQIR